MTNARDPEEIIAAWLEDGPFELPAETRRAIAVGLRTQPRARRMAFHGGFGMTPLVRTVTAAGAAIVVLAIAGALILGRSPSASVGASSSPSPAASPSSDTGSSTGAGSSGTAAVSFTSPLYGYTVSHPAAYLPTPATATWDGSSDVGPDNAQADRFFGGPQRNFVGMASLALPAGTTGTAWMDAYVTAVAGRPCAIPRTAWTETTQNGVPARHADFSCGSDAAELIWVTGSTAWILTGERATVGLMAPTFKAPSAPPSAVPSVSGAAFPIGSLAPGAYHTVSFRPTVSLTVGPGWSRWHDDPELFGIEKNGVRVALTHGTTSNDAAAVRKYVGGDQPITTNDARLGDAVGVCTGPVDAYGKTLYFDNGLNAYDGGTGETVEGCAVLLGGKQVTIAVLGPAAAAAALHDEIFGVVLPTLGAP
jgi:hypothetical protein